MVSSCKLSNEARRYNLPPVQQQRSHHRVDPSLKLHGFLPDPRTSNTMSDTERMDDSGSQRKRIAVACGRCRQRKIRCSGDNGTGEACTNCKSAGADPCQFLRVSSQEVQGVRPASFNYNVALSRKLATRHSTLSPTLSGSSSPYAQSIMATAVGVHGDAADTQHEMPYGCVQKHYDQVHGWAQGYGVGDHGVDYSPSQSTLPMSEQLYMMGSYRSGHQPMVVRSNVVYVDADASSYGYGGGGGTPGPGLDARSTSLPDPSHSFQNGMSCYSNAAAAAAADHAGRCMQFSADNRCRSGGGSSHADGLSDRRTSHLPPGMVEGANMMDMGGSYSGYESGGTCNNGGSSMDRTSGGMYTTAAAATPPDELLIHAGSLRNSIPDYAYRYAGTTPPDHHHRGGGGG
ncbi:hypothetical protein E4U41_004202, partial [Claviceps citrina]